VEGSLVFDNSHSNIVKQLRFPFPRQMADCSRRRLAHRAIVSMTIAASDDSCQQICPGHVSRETALDCANSRMPHQNQDSITLVISCSNRAMNGMIAFDARPHPNQRSEKPRCIEELPTVRLLLHSSRLAIARGGCDRLASATKSKSDRQICSKLTTETNICQSGCDGEFGPAIPSLNLRLPSRKQSARKAENEINRIDEARRFGAKVMIETTARIRLVSDL
jgi:hypothetical protein